MVFEDLKKAVLHRLQALPGRIGFEAFCPETGDRIAWQEELPLEAASVIKLTIMAEMFRRFRDQEDDPQELVTIREEDKKPSCGALTYMHTGLQVTVMDLVTLMIILSDNTATNLLIDRAGMDRINAMIAECGLTASRVNRKLYRPDLSSRGIQNYVSASDMRRLLQMILDERLVSAEASRQMLRILCDQRLNGKLPFYLHSEGIRVAHKTGEDEGITHDVGILFTQRPWILCFLSNQTAVPEAERAMQDIAAWLAGVKPVEAL